MKRLILTLSLAFVGSLHAQEPSPSNKDKFIILEAQGNKYVRVNVNKIMYYYDNDDGSIMLTEMYLDGHRPFYFIESPADVDLLIGIEYSKETKNEKRTKQRKVK
jgi:hypothetical protein